MSFGEIMLLRLRHGSSIGLHPMCIIHDGVTSGGTTTTSTPSTSTHVISPTSV
jgi:hypothetical protein